MQTIRALGVAAQERGCAPTVLKERIEIGPGVFRDVGITAWCGWDKVDGTMLQSPADERRRCTSVMPWSRNACATECLVMAAILMNCWRLQYDQIGRRQELTLNPVATALRSVCTKRWALLTEGQRGRCSEIIRQKLFRYNPATFPPAGQFISVIDAYTVAFEGVNQVTFTWGYARSCCGSSPMLDLHDDLGGDAIYSQNHIQIFDKAEDRTMHGRLNHWFRVKEAKNRRPCGRGQQCTRQLRQRKLVLEDTLPPTLTVFLGVDREDARTNQEFRLDQPVVLNYLSRSGSKQATYVLRMGIFSNNGDHFFLLARRDNGNIWAYDALNNGEAQKELRDTGRTSWYGGPGYLTLEFRDASPQILFYQVLN
jgi:hypothetical protein